MSDDNILSFSNHRRPDDDDLVRCARCGKKILGTVVRCPECGVHFQSEASFFQHPSEVQKPSKPFWGVVVAIVLVVVYLLSMILR